MRKACLDKASTITQFPWMPIQLKHKWVGVAIPSVLILYLQLSTTLVLYYDRIDSNKTLIKIQIVSLVLWISYYLAVITPPGSPPKDFNLSQTESDHQTYWRKWCSKCKQYKPERTHHCKSCGKCVLKMDHHCPWTNNCVGYFNMPHFFRFLIWILISTTYTLTIFAKKLLHVFEMRNLPSYLVSKLNVTIYIVNFLLLGFLLLTVGILFIRCLYSIILNQTMIESWECERLQDNFYTEALWKTVKRNYNLIYPHSEFPNLSSWKVNYRLVKEGSVVPLNFTYEDLVFPYDLGSAYDNLIDALGPVYTWLYPLGKPTGTGIHFIKDKLNEDQLKLPFPIDGYNVDPPMIDKAEEVIDADDENELTLRNWSNVLGETMESFGVDPETENFKTK